MPDSTPAWFRVIACRVIAVLAALLTLAVPRASLAEHDSHVRVVDRSLRILFERGLGESVTLRALVAEVDALPILVFASCSVRLPSQAEAALNLITTIGNVRYVRVLLKCTLSAQRRIALLAHELHHALEIGRQLDVVDVRGLERHYERIGFMTGDNGVYKTFETQGALDTQSAVLRELKGAVTALESAAY